MKSAKKKRGRPAKYKAGPMGGRLSRTRTFRVRGGMDKYLVWHAKEHGRSVSEEIETRLDRSFCFDGLMSAVAGRNAALVYALSTAATIAGTYTIDEKDRSHALQVAAAFIIAAISGVEPMSADWLTKSSFAQQHGLALADTVLASLGAPWAIERLKKIADPLIDPTAKILRETEEAPQSLRDDLSKLPQGSQGISEQILDRVRRRFNPETRALVESIRQLHDAERCDEIARKLEAGDIDGAIEAVGFNPQSFRPYDKKIIEALKAAATAAGGIVQTPEETQNP